MWFVRVCLIYMSMSVGALAWEQVGMARMLTNDAFGDRHDRWRSHSYQAGILLEPGPGQSLLDLVELRFSSELRAPADLSAPVDGDRPFAGVLSLGVHGYLLGADQTVHFGLDLVGVGPFTRTDDVLAHVHEASGKPSDEVVDSQIRNALHPTATLSVSRGYELAGTLQVMPFTQVQVGVETLARFGLDVIAGAAGQGTLPIRDATSGHLIPATHLRARGWALTAGADAAQVLQSRYLPESRGYDLSEPRLRARGGVLWRGRRAQLFYGLAWLGEEFAAQPRGQVLGSIHGNWRF